MLATLLALLAGGDTLRIATLTVTPAIENRVDTVAWGPPGARIEVAGGIARFWLVRADSGVYLALSIPDSTDSWSDQLVIALYMQGDRATAPDHDDFLWAFDRVLDSSVVFRGRNGRWQPPRDDPDWRLGREREGGGWTVRSSSDSSGWQVVIRLDAEYFAQSGIGGVGLEVRIRDADTRSSATWPAWAPLPQPAALDDRPEEWGVVR
ncbi:MAG: hypothetical protein ACHQ2E_05040 [Gemmatimonadales bacterium]